MRIWTPLKRKRFTPNRYNFVPSLSSSRKAAYHWLNGEWKFLIDIFSKQKIFFIQFQFKVFGNCSWFSKYTKKKRQTVELDLLCAFLIIFPIHASYLSTHQRYKSTQFHVSSPGNCYVGGKLEIHLVQRCAMKLVLSLLQMIYYHFHFAV